MLPHYYHETEIQMGQWKPKHTQNRPQQKNLVVLKLSDKMGNTNPTVRVVTRQSIDLSGGKDNPNRM
jgi:hypothetical protein